MKKKTFYRIVTALCTTAVILGAIDVYLIGLLREADTATAVQAVAPSAPGPTQISAEDDDPEAQTGGTCHIRVDAPPPKELPRRNARME
jgi:hypothetical protein